MELPHRSSSAKNKILILYASSSTRHVAFCLSRRPKPPHVFMMKNDTIYWCFQEDPLRQAVSSIHYLTLAWWGPECQGHCAMPLPFRQRIIALFWSTCLCNRKVRARTLILVKSHGLMSRIQLALIYSRIPSRTPIFTRFAVHPTTNSDFVIIELDRNSLMGEIKHFRALAPALGS